MHSSKNKNPARRQGRHGGLSGLPGYTKRNTRRLLEQPLIIRRDIFGLAKVGTLEWYYTCRACVNSFAGGNGAFL